MAKRKKFTVVDVAARAGVSPATVSRAFNRPKLLSPETLDGVMRAAKDLNFIPNALARSLLSGKSGFAALVVPDISDPFFARLAYSLDQALRSEGMVLIVCHTSEQRIEEEYIMRLLEERRIDGLVWVSEAPADGSPSPFEVSSIPRVMIERLPDTEPADAILLDKSGVSKVVEYLVDLGHRRIAMVTGHQQTYGGRELYRAFEQAMSEKGLEVPDQYVVSGDFKYEGGRNAVARLMAAIPPPTAVFVGSDRMSHGFMTGVTENGLRVPDDLSVVAFSTSLIDNLVHPPLTSCQSSYEEIGREAARLLIDRMRDPDSPSRQVVIPTEFLIRRSCRGVTELERDAV